MVIVSLNMIQSGIAKFWCWVDTFKILLASTTFDGYLLHLLCRKCNPSTLFYQLIFIFCPKILKSKLTFRGMI